MTDRVRGGVVTLGATLVSTSYPRRTSPVLRGRWILEDVLGSHVPPPPPNVPALEEHVADKPMSLRERLELHRKNADCASCHNRMDPLGFGLENFDVLARWRADDQGLRSMPAVCCLRAKSLSSDRIEANHHEAIGRVRKAPCT